MDIYIVNYFNMYMKILVKVKELGNGVTLKKAHLYWPPGPIYPGMTAALVGKNL